jgi:DNA-binding transcriptional MerR regulator
MNRKRYTTVEVAREADVPRATLQFWIASGKISAPPVRLVEGRAVRLWSDTDLWRIKKLKGTLKPGPGPKKDKGKK